MIGQATGGFTRRNVCRLAHAASHSASDVLRQVDAVRPRKVCFYSPWGMCISENSAALLHRPWAPRDCRKILCHWSVLAGMKS